MSSFLLRVEAVNLQHVIEDTHDLNTIRGGGLAVLNGPRKELLHWLQTTDSKSSIAKWNPGNVCLVTSGPSVALVKFEVDSPAAAIGISNDVRCWLKTHPTLRHATFVVDVIARTENGPAAFRLESESLLARNRWRQMQECRLSIPRGDSVKPCHIDRVRPAIERNPAANNQKKDVSQSVADRARYGREQKASFYESEVRWKPVKNAGLAWDFHQLAARGEHRFGKDGVDPDPFSGLHDKLAVIYADGNSFGKQQLKFVSDEMSQQKWDGHVQAFRKRVLTLLLKQTDLDDGWRCRLSETESCIRLETLLWGGDELMWVVPAWKGWAVVKLLLDEAIDFYRPNSANPGTSVRQPRIQTQNQGKMRDLNAPKSRQPEPVVTPTLPLPLPPLTHSIGLVFCHAESPIHRIRSLAKQLAEIGKARNKAAFKDQHTKFEDLVSYTVLESFDHAGADPLEARRKHFPSSLRGDMDTLRSKLTFNRSEFDAIAKWLRQIQSAGFPRGSVYRIVRAWQDENKADFQRWIDRGQRESGSLPEPLREFDNGYVWLHIAELWDYIVPGGGT